MNAETASAGPHGVDGRSDCRATVWHAANAAPSIAVQSKVAALYGDAIRAQAQATLAALGTADLSLLLEDSGALPYVIAARIEAAVRRLRPDTDLMMLPAINAAAQPPRQPRAYRSRLYLPGNTPKFFINAGLHHPDAVILDLEDSVAPSEKDAALLVVRNALRAVDFYGARKMVRVNTLPAGLDEIRMLAPHDVDAFLLPKVEDPATVRAAAETLDELGAVTSTLIPIIESARGVLNAYAIASAAPRICALAIGLEDYTADIGAQRTVAGRESLWAQSTVVAAARAAHVEPLASVFSAVDDEAGLRVYLDAIRSLGFAGMGCLHPRQVRVVHAAFAPTPAEIAHAERIVAAFTRAAARGQGVLSVDGAMIDAPVVERARRVLRLAGVTE